MPQIAEPQVAGGPPDQTLTAVRSGTRPLRVLVVNPGGVLGGAESWLLSTLDGTDRLEAHAVLLADGPLHDALRVRGVPVTVHPVGPRAADVVRAAGWLRGQLTRFDPDVVVGNGVKAAAVATPAARLAGVPVVWVKHDHSYDRWLARPLAAASTRVVATAAEVARAAGRADTVVIEPPRPPEPLPRDAAVAALAALGVPVGDRLRLVMLGRFVPYKGVDTAIRALAEPGGAAWDLVALGADEPHRPDERRRLRRLADQLGVGDRVYLGRYVADASRLLPAADALAVLTRPDGARTPGREGFGISAAEAMAAGVPVLAVADGGPVSRRIGPDPGGGSAGVLVPAPDAAAVAAGLGALADPAVRQALGAEGRRRAADQPDATAVAGRFAAVLARTAHRPGAGLPGGPPVSVVSPVLDEAPVIDRLVATVAAQLGPDDEYLLVDGGSTDGTVELLEAWQRRDPRVRLLHSPDGTIARSRNVGVAAARHPVIACTDAGCDPDPGWLAGFRAAAAETGALQVTAPRSAAPRSVAPASMEHRRCVRMVDAPSTASGGGDAPPAALHVGVYRVAVRPGRAFEQAMAAVSWPDPDELRRPTPWRTAYARLFGRAFSARRVDGRSVAFTRDAWAAAGGFPEHLTTAEDEAFGRAVLASGARSALTLDAEVTWHQRPTVAATFRQFRGYGRGGGASRSRLLVGRDAVRLLAYLGLAVLLAAGGPVGAAVAVAGAAAYLSVPVARVFRRRQPPLVLLLLPAALLLKDVAKVVGTTESLLATVRRALRFDRPGRPTGSHPAPGASGPPAAGVPGIAGPGVTGTAGPGVPGTAGPGVTGTSDPRMPGGRLGAPVAPVAALAATGVVTGFLLAALSGPAGPVAMLAVTALLAGLLAVLARPLWGCALVLGTAAVANRELPGGPLGLQVVHAVAVVALAAVLLAVAAGAPTDRLRHPRLRLPLVSAAALGVVAVLSTVGSVTPEKSVRAAATLVAGVLLALAIVLVSRTGTRIRFLLGAAALGSLPMTVPVLLQVGNLSSVYAGAIVQNRPVGGFTQPNQLGSYAALVVFLALGAWTAASHLDRSARRRAERVALAVAALCAAGALIVSVSRGAWLGTVLGLVVLVWLHPKVRRPVAWAVLGALVATVAAVQLVPSGGPVQVVRERVVSITAPSENPYDVRPLTWREAVREFGHRPVLGNGPGTFDVLSGRSPSTLQFYPREHAHNGPLTIAAELGTAGLLAAVAMVVTLAAAVRARARRLRAAHRWHDLGLLAGGAAALAALGGHLLVDYPLRNPLLMVLAWATFGLVLAALVAPATPGQRVRTTTTYLTGPRPAPDPITAGDGPASDRGGPGRNLPAAGPGRESSGAAVTDGTRARRHDGVLHGVARSGGIGLFGALASSVLGFLVVLLVSRALGPTGAGAFSVAVAVTMTLTVAGRLGTDTALVRTLPRLRQLGRDADIRGAVAAALLPVAAVTGVLAALVWAAAPLVAPRIVGGFPAEDTVDLLRVGALAVPLGAVGFVALSATRGLGTVVPLTVVETLVKPVTRLLCVAAALLAGAGVLGVTVAWAVPVLLGAGLAGWALHRALRAVPPGAAGTPTDPVDLPPGAADLPPDAAGTRREVWTFAGPRWLAALCEIAGVHAGVVLVSVLVGTAEAGVYNAAMRLVLAGTLALQALRWAVAPRLSRLLTAGDTRGVEQLHRTSAMWVVLLSWPLYLTMAGWPGQTLAVFGPEFSQGAFALSLLCGALLVNLFTGNVATVLLMSGRSGTMLAITAASVALGIGLTLALAPTYGLSGAAVGKAASMVFENVAVAVAVRRQVGVRTLCRPLWWAAGLAVACFAVPALLLRASGLAVDSIPSVAAVVTVGAVVYLVAGWRLREPFALTALEEVIPTRLAGRLRRPRRGARERAQRANRQTQQRRSGDAERSEVGR